MAESPPLRRAGLGARLGLAMAALYATMLALGEFLGGAGTVESTLGLGFVEALVGQSVMLVALGMCILMFAPFATTADGGSLLTFFVTVVVLGSFLVALYPIEHWGWGSIGVVGVACGFAWGARVIWLGEEGDHGVTSIRPRR